MTLKNVMLMADETPISVLVPGDREVDIKRLQANLAGVNDIRIFEEEDFAKFPGLVKGYIGPQDAKKNGITVYADPRIAPGTSWVTGANAKDKHARNVVNGRDFEIDHYIEAAQIKEGDVLEALKSATNELADAIAEFPAEKLGDKVKHPFYEGEITWADLAMIFYWNDIYHTGQVNYIQVLYGDKS